MNGVNAVKGTDPLPDRMSAEIVVIGSGPGGAVTAALCAEAGRSVLLVEEGENLPLEAAPQFSHEEILQKYRNGGVNIAIGRSKIEIGRAHVELQSLMRISYAVFCLKKKIINNNTTEDELKHKITHTDLE